MRGAFSILLVIGIWFTAIAYSAHAAGISLGSPPAVKTGTIASAGMGWVDSDAGTTPSAIDRARLAVAKSSLNQAEMAEEIYAIDNNCYAANIDQLRTADPAVPGSISVVSSSCTGYLIESPAGDSVGTICSLAKENGISEYHALTPSNAG